jgi:hypothetical protein
VQRDGEECDDVQAGADDSDSALAVAGVDGVVGEGGEGIAQDGGEQEDGDGEVVGVVVFAKLYVDISSQRLYSYTRSRI